MYDYYYTTLRLRQIQAIKDCHQEHNKLTKDIQTLSLIGPDEPDGWEYTLLEMIRPYWSEVEYGIMGDENHPYSHYIRDLDYTADVKYFVLKSKVIFEYFQLLTLIKKQVSKEEYAQLYHRHFHTGVINDYIYAIRRDMDSEIGDDDYMDDKEESFVMFFFFYNNIGDLDVINWCKHLDTYCKDGILLIKDYIKTHNLEVNL